VAWGTLEFCGCDLASKGSLYLVHKSSPKIRERPVVKPQQIRDIALAHRLAEPELEREDGVTVLVDGHLGDRALEVPVVDVRIGRLLRHLDGVGQVHVGAAGIVRAAVEEHPHAPPADPRLDARVAGLRARAERRLVAGRAHRLRHRFGLARDHAGVPALRQGGRRAGGDEGGEGEGEERPRHGGSPRRGRPAWADRRFRKPPLRRPCGRAPGARA
jgi:hypothetical protein